MAIRKHFDKTPRPLVLLVVLFVGLTISASLANAAAMSSGNYSIQTDSVNVGGIDTSSSASYRSRDTLGEIATENSSSTNYALHAGYQQMQEVFISMSAPDDVVMSPAIGGVTGGTANGSTAVTVLTDNPAGYTLSIVASSSPALVSGSNFISDYTPVGADPDFNFSVAATDSEFGFTPEGSDIVAKYKDNGSTCNTGSLDTPDQCWNHLSTSAEVISRRTSANHPLGTLTTIKFRVTSGSSHLQPEGTYRATSTLTALPL